MVDSETSVDASHANDLVDHVKPVFRESASLELLQDHVLRVLEFGLLDRQMRFGVIPPKLLVLQLLHMLVYSGFTLQKPVEVLGIDIVTAVVVLVRLLLVEERSGSQATFLLVLRIELEVNLRGEGGARASALTLVPQNGVLGLIHKYV